MTASVPEERDALGAAVRLDARGVVRRSGGHHGRVGLFSVSAIVALVSRQTSAEQTQLTWFDRGGKDLGTLGPVGGYWGIQPLRTTDAPQPFSIARSAAISRLAD